MTASDAVTVDADEGASIGGLTIGGAVGVGVSGGRGVGVAVAGSVTTNTITDTVKAYIDVGSGVTAQGGKVEVLATDGTIINSSGGGGSLAAGGGTVGVAGAVGFATVTDNVTNTVKAYVDDSTVQADGADVDVKATEQGDGHRVERRRRARDRRCGDGRRRPRRRGGRCQQHAGRHGGGLPG